LPPAWAVRHFRLAASTRCRSGSVFAALLAEVAENSLGQFRMLGKPAVDFAGLASDFVGFGSPVPGRVLRRLGQSG
jgi:hypothetical protein